MSCVAWKAIHCRLPTDDKDGHHHQKYQPSRSASQILKLHLQKSCGHLCTKDPPTYPYVGALEIKMQF
ncbi:hypothetical protein KY290_017442 [Solanum tuberosum]|uniref:Uncharacterized protein n=1 Tax=Solanum tuberosum TaxID=4113 RepID=A0ABQ7VB96_SOLTU|nr:hypothetical protein KY290_017442 [Solanum tuberosum]